MCDILDLAFVVEKLKRLPQQFHSRFFSVLELLVTKNFAFRLRGFGKY